MTDITYRRVKGVRLTTDELDDNLENLDNEKIAWTDLSISIGPVSSGGSLGYSNGVFTYNPVDSSDFLDVSLFSVQNLPPSGNGNLTYSVVNRRFDFTRIEVPDALKLSSFSVQNLAPSGNGNLTYSVVNRRFDFTRIEEPANSLKRAKVQVSTGNAINNSSLSFTLINNVFTLIYHPPESN